MGVGSSSRWKLGRGLLGNLNWGCRGVASAMDLNLRISYLGLNLHKHESLATHFGCDRRGAFSPNGTDCSTLRNCRRGPRPTIVFQSRRWSGEEWRRGRRGFRREVFVVRVSMAFSEWKKLNFLAFCFNHFFKKFSVK